MWAFPPMLELSPTSVIDTIMINETSLKTIKFVTIKIQHIDY